MIEVIIFGCVLLCVLVALLMYWSTAPFLVKLITLPFTIVFSLFIIWQMILMAGAPIKAFPEGEFSYVHHENLNGGKAIALWAWTEQHQDFRLFLFPYDRETAKKLQKAQQKRKQGRKINGKFKKNQAIKGGSELVIQEGNPRPGQPPKETLPDKQYSPVTP
jgi:hypothetical protein